MIFQTASKKLLDSILKDPAYLSMREEHRRRYESTADAPAAGPKRGS